MKCPILCALWIWWLPKCVIAILLSRPQLLIVFSDRSWGSSRSNWSCCHERHDPRPTTPVSETLGSKFDNLGRENWSLVQEPTWGSNTSYGQGHLHTAQTWSPEDHPCVWEEGPFPNRREKLEAMLPHKEAANVTCLCLWQKKDRCWEEENNRGPPQSVYGWMSQWVSD